MFGIFGILGNTFRERDVVGKDSTDVWCVDTCDVTDSEQPFETGIEHHSYNDGKWIIVEMYTTRKAAEKGHEKWVRVMREKKPPSSLRDVSTAGIKRFGEAVGAFRMYDVFEYSPCDCKVCRKK